MCPGTFLTDPGCAGDGLSHAPALPAVSNVFASVSAEPSTPSSFCGTHLGDPLAINGPEGSPAEAAVAARCLGAPGAGMELPLKH